MRILFVHNAPRSFVRVDRDILASEHEIDEFDLSVPARIATLPIRLRRADLTYAWFASLHSLAPVLGAALLRRPAIVVVGGYDTAHVPEIGYGYMAHPIKRHVVRAICDRATALIANSRTAAEEVRRNTRTRTPVHAIYHGFEHSSIPFPAEREPIALTIGSVTWSNLKRKGQEIFVRAASLVPEARFILVGRSDDDALDWLESIAPPNVELLGYLPQAELDGLCARAAVYVQASRHEGFGCALAEAMAAGCFPIVSRQGALPEIVGKYGLYVDECNAASIASGVRQGLAATLTQRQAIAEHITANFSLARRHRALLDLVSTTGRQVGVGALEKAETRSRE
jgi:glycosyltransferase involved in cell wall biosynthesis